MTSSEAGRPVTMASSCPTPKHVEDLGPFLDGEGVLVAGRRPPPRPEVNRSGQSVPHVPGMEDVPHIGHPGADEVAVGGGHPVGGGPAPQSWPTRSTGPSGSGRVRPPARATYSSLVGGEALRTRAAEAGQAERHRLPRRRGARTLSHRSAVFGHSVREQSWGQGTHDETGVATVIRRAGDSSATVDSHPRPGRSDQNLVVHGLPTSQAPIGHNSLP